MSTVTQRSVRSSLVLIAFGLTLPEALTAQPVSARAASIALTVVVPPRSSADGGIASEARVSLLRATPTSVDLETMIGLGNRRAARIEVRLGPSWNTDSTQIWVQNRRGEFERMLRDASVVALDAQRPGDGRSSLHFRVESDRPLTVASLVIPLEYRLTLGGGDEFSVWTFPALLRVDQSR